MIFLSRLIQALVFRASFGSIADTLSISASRALSSRSPTLLPRAIASERNSTGAQLEPLGQSEHQPEGSVHMLIGACASPARVRNFAFGTPIALTLKPAASSACWRTWLLLVRMVSSFE